MYEHEDYHDLNNAIRDAKKAVADSDGVEAAVLRRLLASAEWASEQIQWLASRLESE